MLIKVWYLTHENRYQRITKPVNHLTQIAETHESLDVYVI